MSPPHRFLQRHHRRTIPEARWQPKTSRNMVTKQKAGERRNFVPRTVNPHANLLGIAPELRNRIYEHVLMSQDGPIEMSIAANRQEPGLLITCRQIWKEARAMYWFNNKYHFTVCQFDSLPISRFSAHLLNLDTQKPYHKFANVSASLCKCDHSADMNMRNWMRWLKCVHSLPHAFPQPDASHFDLDGGSAIVKGQTRNLAVGAFGMVQQLSDVP